MNGAGLHGLAEEQAAFRRVATLVARGTPQHQLFAAVTAEIGQLLAVEYTYLGRYEPDGMFTLVASWGRAGKQFRAGNRAPVGGKNLVTTVFKTGRSARTDSLADASGPLGVAARDLGVRSAVGTPILVEGHLWGVAIAGSIAEQSLPPDTEARLGSFTELVATAIANAESRAALSLLVEQEAALRRVATLVARGVRQDELFATVTEESGRLLPVQYAYLGRYEPDGTLVIIGAWGRTGDTLTVGSRQSVGGQNLVTRVFETARSARMDDYSDASGAFGVDARKRGVRSAVATPILVESRLWGVMIAGAGGEQPLPVDTESRLESFTELVATAISNAESRAGLARLAEEQEALRHIATLVARGVPPEELFDAVVEVIGRLLDVDLANMCRYEPDRTQTFIATWGRPGKRFPLGSRWPLGGKNIGTIVFETRRPARIENYADASGPVNAIARKVDLRSAVGTPIFVEGRLWGMIGVGSSQERPLPPDTEARLASFTELVVTAIANAESRADLAASRARIVAAADESRRQIERDLHDGAQQRLVHAVIVLKLALRALSDGNPGASEMVTEARRHAEQANAELRELAHGILPGALTRGGLRAGVEALVSRLSLPVSVDVPVERLPTGVEATAYFVVSEALTNVLKHARAATATVTARVEAGQLRVEVSDDGVGGARGDHGTGLGGLADRVSALDGRLVVESPPRGGTRVCVLLPVSDEG